MKSFLIAIASSLAPAILACTDTGPQRKEAPLREITATIKTGRFEAQGDRQGHVTVLEAATGKRVATFMARPEVVRRVFLLDDGGTLVVSQKDQSIFWDLATNRELHRIDEQVYGFNHAGDRFFTFSRPEGAVLRDYPAFDRICTLQPAPGVGPESFSFSPDDRYLAILFSSGRPESDESFPHSDPVRRGIRYSRLFDVGHCREIDEFTKLDAKSLGEFSEDSLVYQLPLCTLTVDGKAATGSWRFDLRSARLSASR